MPVKFNEPIKKAMEAENTDHSFHPLVTNDDPQGAKGYPPVTHDDPQGAELPPLLHTLPETAC